MIHARFDWGQEQSIPVRGYTTEQIEDALQNIVELGKSMPRSDESTPHDMDVIFMYSSDPHRYQWTGSFSPLQ